MKLTFALLLLLSGCATTQPDVTDINARITALEEEVDWQQQTLEGLLTTFNALIENRSGK